MKEYYDYLEQEQNFKPVSVYEYKRVLEHLTAVMGDPLKAEDYRTVKNGIVALRDKNGWGRSMTAKAASIVVKFYRWAMREKLISYNPYPISDFKRPQMKEPGFLTEPEFLQIAKNPLLTLQDRVILWLLWDTGIRRAECVSLDISDVDFENRVIHINRECSKGEYTFRYVPFTDKTASLLKEHIDGLKKHSDQPYLFVNSAWTRLADNQLSDRMKEIGDIKTPKRESKRFHAHMLRHSLPIRLLEKGAPDTFIMKLMGHKNHDMLAHYTHTTKKTNKQLYDKYLEA